MRINNSTVELTMPTTFTITGTSQTNQLLVSESTIYQKSKEFFGNFIAKLSKAGHEISEAIKEVDNGGFQPEDMFMTPAVNENLMTETIRTVVGDEHQSTAPVIEPVIAEPIFQPVEATPVAIEMPAEVTSLVEPSVPANDSKVTLNQFLEAFEVIKIYTKQQAEEMITLQNQYSVVKGTADAQREAISGLASAIQNQQEPVSLNQPANDMQRVME